MSNSHTGLSQIEIGSVQPSIGAHDCLRDATHFRSDVESRERPAQRAFGEVGVERTRASLDAGHTRNIVGQIISRGCAGWLPESTNRGEWRRPLTMAELDSGWSVRVRPSGTASISKQAHLPAESHSREEVAQ
jgi:hypothetical protein